MNDDEMVELVDAIADLLEENGVTAGEWSAISQRVQNELDARDES
jgi:hypothetical protein